MNRLSPSFTAATATGLLVLWMGSFVHLVFVRHAVCEHGEATHLSGDPLPAPRTIPATGARFDERGSSRVGSGHDHGCAAFGNLRIRTVVACASGPLPAAAPLNRFAGAGAPHPRTGLLLSIAPSRSPPLA